MGEMFIEKLKEFVEKYQIPSVHRILVMFIRGMLKIRLRPEFAFGTISAINLIKNKVIRRVKENEEKNWNDLENDISDLTFAVIVFPELNDDEVSEILAYCEEILPNNQDSLESHLNSLFGSSANLPGSPNYPLGEDFLLSSATFEMVSGFYSERFDLRPVKEVLSDQIVKAVQNFYERKDFKLHDKSYRSVTLEKDDKFINIHFSHYGHLIMFTVQELS